MKEKSIKRLIIVLYWVVIGVLVWFSSMKDMDMPITERILSFLCFTTITIMVTLSFSKLLFQQTIRDQKTIPFLIKFIMMTIIMIIGLGLMGKLFVFLERTGLVDSVYYLSHVDSPWARSTNALPSLVSANFMICVILLYYEYSILKQSNLESQLKLLHAQINPHFMFNVLNYLYVLMQKDTELASELLLKYSDTLRYQLYNGKKETVKLEHDVQFLKDFIDVETFRWKDKLDIECKWNIENGNKDIPPLLFIPLIENAFKHVSSSKEEKGYIYIGLEQKRHIIVLKVMNSISGNSSKSKKGNGGIGLSNLKKRLDILYGKLYTLTLREEDKLFFSELTIYRI